MINKLQQCH